MYSAETQQLHPPWLAIDDRNEVDVAVARDKRVEAHRADEVERLHAGWPQRAVDAGEQVFHSLLHERQHAIRIGRSWPLAAVPRPSQRSGEPDWNLVTRNLPHRKYAQLATISVRRVSHFQPRRLPKALTESDDNTIRVEGDNG